MTLPVIIGIALSYVLEHRIRPRAVPFWRRGLSANVIHVGIWLVLFCVELLLFRRPWLAAANVCVLVYVFVLVSNAKCESLREPFIFQDFDYCVDVLKHPRLYLPFLGLWRAAVGVGTICFALYLGLILEPSLLLSVSLTEFLLMWIVVLAVGLALLWCGSYKRPNPSLDPQTDVQRMGLLACLWVYGLTEKSTPIPSLQGQFNVNSSLTSRKLPHLVVVQSESFFDVRKQFPIVKQDVLREYDVTKSTALQYGEVVVPAWGANTVRTEFAFLSALAPEILGVHRFNPYRRAARSAVPTLASVLRSLGYATICVHPYPASFYRRDKVYPLLGFDEFIDIRNFDRAQGGSPYIDDVSLASKVMQLLDGDNSRPSFIFVISMENHGPLHLEKCRPDEVDQFYSRVPTGKCDDLTIYIRHLRNADRMVGMLRDHLDAMTRPTWLCWYGDHVPIMPAVYHAMGLPTGKTDYFIWGKERGIPVTPHADLKIEALAPLLLRKAGLVA